MRDNETYKLQRTVENCVETSQIHTNILNVLIEEKTATKRNFKYCREKFLKKKPSCLEQKLTKDTKDKSAQITSPRACK